MKKYLNSLLGLSLLLVLSTSYASNVAMCFYNDSGRVLRVNYPTSATGAGAEPLAYLKLFDDGPARVAFTIKAEGMVPEGNVVTINAEPPSGPMSTGHGTEIGYAYIYLYVDSDQGVTASLKYKIDYNEGAASAFLEHCSQLKSLKPTWWPKDW